MSRYMFCGSVNSAAGQAANPSNASIVQGSPLSSLTPRGHPYHLQNANHASHHFAHHQHHTAPQLIGHPSLSNSLLNSGHLKKEPTYAPQIEAISPTLPIDDVPTKDSNSKSKDEQALLIEKLKKVDGEIAQIDKQIQMLTKQKQQLEIQASRSQATSRQDKDNQESVGETKQLSITKLVCFENRTKALKAHSMLANLGGIIKDLPVYNQPFDNEVIHQNAKKFTYSFKAKLINCFRERYLSRIKLEELISTEYDVRMRRWLKAIELNDSQPPKRQRDAKQREFFEKHFPELKKQREVGERFTRVGQRVARNDAELEEIIDGISEREAEDKRIKSYAVIPPMLEEIRSKKPKYINKNGFVEDVLTEYKEYQIMNFWTEEEKKIFRENYLEHPKNFGLIASLTQRKSVSNCVQYYYLSKKNENYKQSLKRQQKRRTRSFVKPTQAQTQSTFPPESKSNGASLPDKQGGDSIMNDEEMTDDRNDHSEKFVPETPKVDKTIDKKVGPSSYQMIDPESAMCCICICRFNDSSQWRNVTRSNCQFYGISAETLKPGMRICFSCRFRHVKHPSFDEPSKEKEELETSDENTRVLVDPERNNEMHQDQDSLTTKSVNLYSPTKLSSRNHPSEARAISPTSNRPIVGHQARSVQDMIFHTIEMSFQKPFARQQFQPSNIHQQIPLLSTKRPNIKLPVYQEQPESQKKQPRLPPPAHAYQPHQASMENGALDLTSQPFVCDPPIEAQQDTREPASAANDDSFRDSKDSENHAPLNQNRSPSTISQDRADSPASPSAMVIDESVEE